MIRKKVLIVISITALLMLIYESLKEFFFYDLTKWESHLVTIIVSSVFAGIAAYYVIGKIYLLVNSLNKEISDRLQAEKYIKQQLNEKETLLKEVHHRIKNNIESIRNILKWQTRLGKKGKSQKVVEDAISRIESMRILYDKLLLTSDYKDISVKHYLEELIKVIVELFPENNRIIIKKEIVDFKLNAKRLFSLGTIVNELITNSLKYGFDNKKSGKIDIFLSKKGHEITLSIHDNGNGLADDFDIDKSSGFGLTIVKMLAEQLHGTFSIKPDNGAKCTVSFDL